MKNKKWRKKTDAVNVREERVLTFIKESSDWLESVARLDNDLFFRRIALFLSRDTILQLKDDRGNTLLHTAASEGSLSVLHQAKDWLKEEKLEVRQTIVNQLNHQGQTALSLACREGQANCVKILLSMPGVNHVVEGECFPLHEAVAHERVDCLHLLLSKNFSTTQQKVKSVNVKNQHHETVLHVALRPLNHRGSEEALTIENIECIKRVVAAGASLHARYKGRNPLHMAVIHRAFNLIHFLLDNGAQIYWRDSWNRSALDLVDCSDPIRHILLNSHNAD